jgi:hypothetical protein
LRSSSRGSSFRLGFLGPNLLEFAGRVQICFAVLALEEFSFDGSFLTVRLVFELDAELLSHVLRLR